MGKSLLNKELGAGLRQKKNGLYSARFYNRYGKRVEKYFKTLPEAKNWLASAKYEDTHPVTVDSDMTVDEWYKFWVDNIICDRAPNTIRNYKDRYVKNIYPVIGKMKLSELKPMYCKMVFNQMTGNYAGSTIRQTYIALGTMLRSAVENGLISKHPMDGVRFITPVKAKGDINVLTVDEQMLFVEAAKRSHHCRVYMLILETGLRTGELIGLTFDDIDWELHTLSVKRTLEYRHSTGVWRAGPPKTKTSYRTIPLSDRAYAILKSCYDEKSFRYESPILDQKLPYTDLFTGEQHWLDMRNLVFINYRTGEPTKNSSYDTHLYKITDEAGLKHVSMHMLRHCYATRAIEQNMPPKVLQKLLGHKNLSVTMDCYVHVTDQSLGEAVRNFSNAMSELEKNKSAM